MENKNTVVALILMLIVWTGFTYLFPPKQQSTVASSKSISKVTSESSHKQSQEKLNIDDDKSNVNLVETVKTLPSDVSGNEVKFIDIENSLYKIRLSSKGASIVSFLTKKYKKTNSSDKELVSLVDKKNISGATRITGSGDFDISDNYVYSVKSNCSGKIDKECSIIFYGKNNNGMLVDIIYTFYPNSYKIGYSIVLKNTDIRSKSGSLVFSLRSLHHKQKKPASFQFVGPVCFADEKLNKVDFDDLSEKSPVYSEGIEWAGYETKYFLKAAVADTKVVDKISFTAQNNLVFDDFHIPTFKLDSTQSFHSDFILFFGPKEINALSAVGHNLSKVIDFGFFKIIAEPLHFVLNFFYKYVGNYGIAIILLTIIIKVIFWPLTQKSYVSMREMQVIQPEMKKLRERFAGDKEMLNKKMMELYKEHHVNPLGGCLPMLIQIPVFFALYKVLLDTIELRHAPFAFWITDLSLKDPYYVTPIIMGITMFIQQKLSPSSMEPMQAKLMMAMPVVFTFMFLNFPSGLVIYWLVNNLLTILQQYFIFKKYKSA